MSKQYPKWDLDSATTIKEINRLYTQIHFSHELPSRGKYAYIRGKLLFYCSLREQIIKWKQEEKFEFAERLEKECRKQYNELPEQFRWIKETTP